MHGSAGHRPCVTHPPELSPPLFPHHLDEGLHHSGPPRKGGPQDEQCSKKASVSLLWLLKSSGIIADRPWPRVSLTVLTTAIILTMAVFNMFFLSDPEETIPPTANTSNTSLSALSNQAAILRAQNLFFLPYFIYSCILGLISCSVFLRVNYELKMLIMMVALVGYNTILLHTHAHVLDDYSQVLFERHFFLATQQAVEEPSLNNQNSCCGCRLEHASCLEPGPVTQGPSSCSSSSDHLPPRFVSVQEPERQYLHLGTMVEFAFALVAKLDAINKHSFNDFKLRVGINHGPVIAGVIGAQKPQYDIWGNTVNVASRMDSTGVLDKIQVTEETSLILQTLGYTCTCRGIINVKGKGELKTYFVNTEMSRSLSQSNLAS
ncbi:adenylate cyclase type 2-like [Leptonychotes weddellii]|uniref:adenylate cyclase n=1 Tax=Leptonychotes weddellii TaxID=9713 RepID=A0A7F8RMF7_LEPWE|nr:adenylate cyclase type 2-like [Leptonychotes weddellii]